MRFTCSRDTPAIAATVRLFFLLQCMTPLVAQSEHPDALSQCPLFEVKRTSAVRREMSA
jgi:hypothetical protein